jgi:hypothetical protein
VKWGFLGVLGLIVLPLFLAVIGLGMKTCAAPVNLASRAVTVAQEELDPRTLLNRYMWFKDASAALDKKKADIALYEQRLAKIEAQYAGRETPRHVVEQQSLWATEMLGVKASYNSLVAEYNAAMAKINWRFTNVGDLPAGESQVLPRSYREYVTQ